MILCFYTIYNTFYTNALFFICLMTVYNEEQQNVRCLIDADSRLLSREVGVLGMPTVISSVRLFLECNRDEKR